MEEKTKGSEAITPAVLDRAQVCAYLAIGPTKLAELTACGKVPSLVIGRRRLYRRAALDAWLAALEAEQAA